MTDGLKAIVQELAGLQFAKDADIQFLKQLETQILVYVHQQLGQGSQAQDPSAAGGAGPQGPMASVPGMTPGGGDQGVPGLMQGPGQLPNPDEFRRMVGAASQS